MDKLEFEKQIARLQRRLERTKNARIEAEHLLESKSRELYVLNQELHENTRLLEASKRWCDHHRC